MFYKLLNVYTRNFSFPYRGLKYFLKAAKSLGIANKTYKKRLHNNFFMLLNPTEHIQQQLFWYGYYEKELGDLLKKLIKPDQLFIDIGANLGYFSLLVATSSPSVKVISFEPVDDLFRKINENISVNNVKNIVPIHAAVGEKDEEKELFISAADNSGMSSFQEPENYSGAKEKVKVVTLDDWIKTSRVSKVDIIKLDIEGSELAALNGMKEVLQNFKPLVIVEINPETLALFDLKPLNIYNYFKQLGFVGFFILENGFVKELRQTEHRQTINVLFAHQEKIGSLTPSIVTQ
jgi:FkbM family methyltransferase